MSPRSKREYLAAIVKRYRAASRKTKTAILNEFCSACGYHLKACSQASADLPAIYAKDSDKTGQKAGV